MKILHISDLHYDGRNNKNIPILKEYISARNIDICLFTGDIVDQGNDMHEAAYNYLFSGLEEAGVTELFICCGNHDIDRKSAEIYQEFLGKQDSFEKVNKLVTEKNGDQFSNTLYHIRNYQALVRNKYSSDYVSDLYAIHKRIIKGKQVAIVSINLAWNSLYSQSYGKLIFPDIFIDEIIEKIKDCEFKILISHFDTKFLKVDLQKRFNEKIFKVFDVQFVGHSHESEDNNSAYSWGGVFTSTAAMLKYEPFSDCMGFKIISYDFEDNTVCVESSIIKNNFISEKKEVFNLPVDELKKRQLKLYSCIQAKKEEILQKADALFLIDRRKDAICFSDLFIYPEFVETSISDYRISKKNQRKENVMYKELLSEDNYLIFGSNKSGKSALLYKLYIDLLSNYRKSRILPIYIDCSKESSDKDINLRSRIKAEYSLSNAEFDALADELSIRVLIDNIQFDAKGSINKFLKSLDSSIDCKNVSYVLTSEKKYNSEFIELEKDIQCKKLFINSIDRRAVRELTNRWPLDCDRIDAVEKITKILSSMNFGFNFWTVSMLLYVIDKTDDFKVKNSAELIGLYIEKILDKESLIIQDGVLTYEILTQYLSLVSHSMFSTRRGEYYYLSYFELMCCFEKFTESNIRIVVPGKKVIDYLIEHKVIAEIETDRYSFLMSGLFEYFLAIYMVKNDEFKKKIISDPDNYMVFSNEIEIYSGIMKGEQESLETIYCELLDLRERITETIDTEYDYEENCSNGNKKAQELTEVARLLQEEVRPVPLERQDEIKDATVPLRETNSKIPVKRSQSLTKYTEYIDCLSVLGKVFRNMDEIQDVEALIEIFEFLLNESCLSLYYLITEFLRENDEENNPLLDSSIDVLVSFTPLIAHSVLYEMVSHPTLAKLIKREIDKLSSSESKHEVKLFVLYMLLIETNLENEIGELEKLMDKISAWSVYQSLYFKLLILAAFKTKGNKQVYERLEDYMEQIYKKIGLNSNIKTSAELIRTLKKEGLELFTNDSTNLFLAL